MIAVYEYENCDSNANLLLYFAYFSQTPPSTWNLTVSLES